MLIALVWWIMEEIITSILEAEKLADEIVKNAADSAKNIMIYAENNADEIREKAVNDFKAHRKAVIIEAEKNAEKSYAARIEQGKAEAKKLADGVSDKISAVANTILNGIIG